MATASLKADMSGVFPLHSFLFSGRGQKLLNESIHKGFPSGAVVKNLLANAVDTKDVGLIPGLIPGSRRSPTGNGHTLQYSCLENSMDRGSWRATFQGVVKSRT